jgi:alpha-tubulin suppressor-like RCC1 family protein
MLDIQGKDRSALGPYFQELCMRRFGRTARFTRCCALPLAALLLSAPGCREDVPSPLAPDQPPALATATTALAFSQVSGGYLFTCGLTTGNRAYCWGYNVQSQLGDGTAIERHRPVPVAGTLRFRGISAGAIVGCGVTTDFRAYCWGANDFGELGDGTNKYRSTPVAVAGGHLFRQVETNWKHTCGVSYPDDLAYCWGENLDGELGDGTRTTRLKPVPVAGGLHFRRVSVGWSHTCGVTTDNRIFCWGLNNDGQVGDSSTAARRLKPSRVGRTRQWHDVDAGAYHTCAVTTSDRAFCWGNGSRGELGNGQSNPSFWPRAVAGTLSFHRVSAGYEHTCGEAAGDKTYCWGYSGFGQLGGGLFIDNPRKPVAVAGGLALKQVSAGGFHTCGRTLAGVGYCWGYNAYGALGDGTTIDRFTPVPIAAAP